MIVIAVVVVLGVFVAGRLMKANKEAQNTINTLCQFTDEKKSDDSYSFNYKHMWEIKYVEDNEFVSFYDADAGYYVACVGIVYGVNANKTKNTHQETTTASKIEKKKKESKGVANQDFEKLLDKSEDEIKKLGFFRYSYQFSFRYLFHLLQQLTTYIHQALLFT